MSQLFHYGSIVYLSAQHTQLAPQNIVAKNCTPSLYLQFGPFVFLFFLQVGGGEAEMNKSDRFKRVSSFTNVLQGTT